LPCQLPSFCPPSLVWPVPPRTGRSRWTRRPRSPSPTWVTVFGLTNFNPAKSDNMVDTTDYDAVGWTATQPFLSGFTVTGSVERKLYSGALDVGQEFLRSQNFAKLTVHARWFDRTGAAEAFDGWGFTTWENQGGDPNTADIVNFTLSGNGALTSITNPFATLVVATVGSATPSGVSVGGIVRITGFRFHRRHVDEVRGGHGDGHGHHLGQPDRGCDARRLGGFGPGDGGQRDGHLQRAGLHPRRVITSAAWLGLGMGPAGQHPIPIRP
jgi:hypothetical protein